MANNIYRLKEEACIMDVIQSLNIEVTKRGSSYFILCPNPEHNDTHPTNCYFKDGWNHVFCWGCQKSINAIDLIMMTLHIQYGEACDLLWEISGRPDWYYEKRKKSPEKFRLKREEAELIGFHNPSRIKIPTAIMLWKESGYSGITTYEYESDCYLRMRNEPVSYLDFISEADYISLVFEKTVDFIKTVDKKILFLKSLKDELKKREIQDPLLDEMISILNKNREKGLLILKRIKTSKKTSR